MMTDKSVYSETTSLQSLGPLLVERKFWLLMRKKIWYFKKNLQKKFVSGKMKGLKKKSHKNFRRRQTNKFEKSGLNRKLTRKEEEKRTIIFCTKNSDNQGTWVFQKKIVALWGDLMPSKAFSCHELLSNTNHEQLEQSGTQHDSMKYQKKNRSQYTGITVLSFT